MTDSAPRKRHALPLYLQISEFLIREIASGRLIDGERLPPERDMAKQHGTTVRTLRKALLDLETKGLLDRIHGSGNYVRAGGQVDSVYSMFRLELIEGGGLPGADVIAVDVRKKEDGMPAFGTSALGTRIRRLRFLNDLPIAVEEIWLDADAGNVDADRLQDSLYRYYQQKLGLWIARAEDRVGIGQVPDWTPSAFSLAPGTTTAYIERLSWAHMTIPVEFSRTWYDVSKVVYVQRLI